MAGTPWSIRDNLVEDFRGVEFRPIVFEADGLRRRTDISGVLAYEIEGVASRNGSGEPFYTDNTAHPANRRLALAFVLERWRDGTAGALRMGAEHGAYCLGCCALLMTLLFVGGVMNLLWVAAIAAFVLLEKLLPAGEAVARAAGVLSIAFGAWLALK